MKEIHILILWIVVPLVVIFIASWGITGLWKMSLVITFAILLLSVLATFLTPNNFK